MEKNIVTFASDHLSILEQMLLITKNQSACMHKQQRCEKEYMQEKAIHNWEPGS
jgi:hypothetical protein